MKKITRNIVLLVVILLAAGIYYYVALPPINIHAAGFWTTLGLLIAFVTIIYALTQLRKRSNENVIPGEVIPVFVVRLFSNSAATGLVLDIFKKYGTDSVQGYICSIMMSSTETVFYTMSVYFMSVKIKKTRWTLSGAMLAAMAGAIASIILAEKM